MSEQDSVVEIGDYKIHIIVDPSLPDDTWEIRQSLTTELIRRFIDENPDKIREMQEIFNRQMKQLFHQAYSVSHTVIHNDE